MAKVFVETPPANSVQAQNDKAKELYDKIQFELLSKSKTCDCPCVGKYVEIGSLIKDIYKSL
jgi:hypothetical protein